LPLQWIPGKGDPATVNGPQAAAVLGAQLTPAMGMRDKAGVKAVDFGLLQQLAPPAAVIRPKHVNCMRHLEDVQVIDDGGS